MTTEPNWRHQAANLTLQAELWDAAADYYETTDIGLGNLGPDYAIGIARSLRDMAQEARWTATECAMYADEEAPPRTVDVGRTDEVRNGARVTVFARKELAGGAAVGEAR